MRGARCEVCGLTYDVPCNTTNGLLLRFFLHDEIPYRMPPLLFATPLSGTHTAAGKQLFSSKRLFLPQMIAMFPPASLMKTHSANSLFAYLQQRMKRRSKLRSHKRNRRRTGRETRNLQTFRGRTRASSLQTIHPNIPRLQRT
jgi:hypothetical protein